MSGGRGPGAQGRTAPATAVRLVRASVAPDSREEVLDDLEEVYRAKSDCLGSGAAKRWYWQQAGHFVTRALWASLTSPFVSLVQGHAFQEIWIAKRIFRSAPYFSAVVVSVLALGIGANTAMFDTARRVILQPLPFADPMRLVLGEATFEGEVNPYASGADYVDYRERVAAFESLAASMPFGQDYTLTGQGDAERMKGVAVTTNLFSTLGIPPAAGRDFVEAEGLAGAPDVVMLSHGYWVRRYAGDAGVIGSSITLNGAPHTVVGVSARDFSLFESADFWRPMRPDLDGAAERIYHNWLLIGRLRDDVGIDQAQAQADVVSAQLAEAYPESNRNKSLLVTPLHESLVAGYQRNLVVLGVALSLLLLIAAGNVTAMFLARAPTRRSELSIRAALGAERGRLIAQLLGEGLWVSAAAGVVGTGLALFLEVVIHELLSLDLPGLQRADFSLSILATAILLSTIVGGAAALYPAVIGSGGELNRHLRETRGTDPRGARFRSVLVSGQVAISVVLLIGSGLLFGSMRSAGSVDPGFRVERLLTAELSLPRNAYPTHQSTVDFFTGVTDAIRVLPGVEDVTAANNLPLRDPGNTYAVWARAEDKPEDSFAYRTVLPGYFEGLEIPLVSGRPFRETDVLGAPQVGLLSEGAARRLFPEGDAIGQTIVQDYFGEERVWEVVGIASDVHVMDLETDPRFVLYVPITQRSTSRARLAIRYTGDAAPLVIALRQTVAQLDSDVPVAGIRPMDDVVSDLLERRRSVVTALSLYALLPLIMAAVGLYALLAYHVRSQRREIGIRLALGARPGTLGRIVLQRGLKLGAAGVTIGIVVALLLGRIVRGFLFGVAENDLVTFCLVGVGVLALTVASTAVPAIRAVRTDPLVALQAED